MIRHNCSFYFASLCVKNAKISSEFYLSQNFSEEFYVPSIICLHWGTKQLLDTILYSWNLSKLQSWFLCAFYPMLLGTCSYPYRKICNRKLGFTPVETGFGVVLSIKSLKYSDAIVWGFKIIFIQLYIKTEHCA